MCANELQKTSSVLSRPLLLPQCQLPYVPLHFARNNDCEYNHLLPKHLLSRLHGLNIRQVCKITNYARSLLDPSVDLDCDLKPATTVLSVMQSAIVSSSKSIMITQTNMKNSSSVASPLLTTSSSVTNMQGCHHCSMLH